MMYSTSFAESFKKTSNTSHKKYKEKLKNDF